MILLAFIASGCAGTETPVTPEPESPSGGSSVVSGDDSGSSEVAPSTPDTDTGETAEETTSPTADTGSSVDLGAYLGQIIPIIERHNATRKELSDASETFGMATIGMNAVEDYCKALAIAKPKAASEYSDASSIVPPAAQSGFHADLCAALEKYSLHVDSHLTYYEGVLENGTNEQSLYDTGLAALQEADKLWAESVIPGLNTMANP